MRVKVYLTVETMYAYTNLTFTPKAKEDALKLYDLFIGSGLFNSVIECIPAEEWKDLQDSVWETITNIYDYKNSVMGILEAINSDYNNLNLDATEIQTKLGDPENLALLKQILAKLG